MRKLLLSLLALGALGLVACGEGDGDQAAVASEGETTREELAADNKSCGAFLPDHDPPFRLAVVEGDISCPVARRVMHDWAYDRLPRSWSCLGPEANVLCTKRPGASSTRLGASSRIAITARFSSEAVTVEADPGNDNSLSNEEKLEQKGNLWAAAFAKAGPVTCRSMGQPMCERASCERVATGPIENCTPVSYEFRKSFAKATVERVVIEGHHATVEFSNGESVEFQRPEGSGWWITGRWVKKITRKDFEP